ncbi:transposable element Tc1 transposase [Trichonephila clavipes]|nr:transposable element Tc1 transposase [Trichonephila clavipes]
MFSDESRFYLYPGDHRRRVWRRSRQSADPAFTIARPTGPQQRVMLNNAKPHTTRVAMKCLTAYQTLPWPARPPERYPIEHIWDIMGRRQHLPANVDDLAGQLEQKFGKKYRRRPSGCLITLCHVVRQLASRLEVPPLFSGGRLFGCPRQRTVPLGIATIG